MSLVRAPAKAAANELAEVASPRGARDVGGVGLFAERH